MKGEKRLNEIDDELDKLISDLDQGVITEEAFSKAYKTLRKEMALILYNDAKKELAEVEKEIKITERDLESFLEEGLVIMAQHGVKQSEKLVERIIRRLKSAVKLYKKSRTDLLRVMKDESKYL